jgi:hypothetical protein
MTGLSSPSKLSSLSLHQVLAADLRLEAEAAVFKSRAALLFPRAAAFGAVYAAAAHDGAGGGVTVAANADASAGST